MKIIDFSFLLKIIRILSEYCSIKILCKVPTVKYIETVFLWVDAAKLWINGLWLCIDPVVQDHIDYFFSVVQISITSYLSKQMDSPTPNLSHWLNQCYYIMSVVLFHMVSKESEKSRSLFSVDTTLWRSFYIVLWIKEILSTFKYALKNIPIFWEYTFKTKEIMHFTCSLINLCFLLFWKLDLLPYFRLDSFS